MPGPGTGNGGRHDHRTKDQREQDLKRIADLRFEGKTQTEIAAIIGVSQTIISRDLRELRKRWQMESTAKIDELICEDIAHWKRLQFQYWDGYQRSLRERRDSEGTLTDGMDEGDPRFLQGMERCLDKRAELLGIKPPSKIAPTNPKGDEPYQQSGVLIVEKIKTPEEWCKGAPGYDGSEDNSNET